MYRNNWMLHRMIAKTECHQEKNLEVELERLKNTLKLGYELRINWVPRGSEKLSGEVKNETIYIYDENEKEALETLRHEFLDYAISRVIEPYREMTNKLISLINEEAYRRKEKLVEALSYLI